MHQPRASSLKTKVQKLRDLWSAFPRTGNKTLGQYLRDEARLSLDLMRRFGAWRRLFEDAQPVTQAADSFDEIARLATATTSMAELGYSVEAQSVLEQMGVSNVRELLAVDGVLIPVISSAQWARIPQDWIEYARHTDDKTLRLAG